MRKNLRSAFNTRQYMLSKDFEIYYYSDSNLENVALHSHAYYEFYFFMEGDISIQIGNDILPSSAGDLMLIPPHLHHRPIIHSLDVPYQRFVFWISQEYCQDLMALSPDYVYLMQYVQTSKTYIFHNDRITFNAVQSRLIRLVEEMNSNRFGRNTQLTLCVNDLLLYVNRLVYDSLHPKSREEEISLYQNLLEYLEEHLDEDLSLDTLADQFYVSKYHIAHVFKHNLGMSIHQYITKKRLALCREAILSNMSITKAYQSFGFGDYSSFYRAFKKEFGISPKDFRDSQMKLASDRNSR